jgi:AcrR family transcriptional regulator
MTDALQQSRPRRSDGERTHAAILQAALELASMEGISALTLGRLAERVGVSKSGLYAHFRSKRNLQLEVLAAAREIFQHEVIDRALTAPPGRPRLEALCDAYLRYVERRVFPGGCFFAGMLAEFDAQTGDDLHHEVAADQREWVELVESLVHEAQQRGELAASTEPAQLAFDITAALEHANYYSVLFDDPTVIHRARSSIADAITRAIA